jgi:hypothetical protein
MLSVAATLYRYRWQGVYIEVAVGFKGVNGLQNKSLYRLFHCYTVSVKKSIE